MFLLCGFTLIPGRHHAQNFSQKPETACGGVPIIGANKNQYLDPINIYSIINIKYIIYLLMYLTSTKPSFRDVSIWALQRMLLEKWARHATCNWAARLAAFDSNSDF
jgi:hypothetical protein